MAMRPSLPVSKTQPQLPEGLGVPTKAPRRLPPGPPPGLLPRPPPRHPPGLPPVLPPRPPPRLPHNNRLQGAGPQSLESESVTVPQRGDLRGRGGEGGALYPGTLWRPPTSMVGGGGALLATRGPWGGTRLGSAPALPPPWCSTAPPRRLSANSSLVLAPVHSPRCATARAGR
jgi:hypothetical protein